MADFLSDLLWLGLVIGFWFLVGFVLEELVWPRLVKRTASFFDELRDDRVREPKVAPPRRERRH